MVCAVNRQGERTLTTLKEVIEGESFPGRQRRKALTFDLRSLTKCSPDEYLQGIGMVGAIQDGQDVYELVAEGHRYLVPASVLLQGLIRMTARFSHVLFHPLGRDLYFLPTCKAGEVYVDVKAGVLPDARRTAQTNDRLVWLTCYPTARRFWDSVYANAAHGRLSVDLPAARVHVRLKGSAKRHLTLVDWMTVATLEPQEAPSMFEREIVVRTFTFDLSHQQTPKGHGRRRQTLEGLPEGEDGWQLSDDEWQQVSTLLDRRRTYGPRHFARHSLSLVLEKFGKGLSWKDFEPRIPAYYRKLRLSGKWELVLSTLRTVRTESALACLPVVGPSKWATKPAVHALATHERASDDAGSKPGYRSTK